MTLQQKIILRSIDFVCGEAGRRRKPWMWRLPVQLKAVMPAIIMLAHLETFNQDRGFA